MCYFVIVNLQIFQDYKLNKDYVHTNSMNIISQANDLLILNTNRVDKSTGTNIKTNNFNKQEAIQISLEEAKVKHAQNTKASESKAERIIDPKKPMVALTFDDGPHNKYTIQILDSLKKYNGIATFFVLGSRAEKHKSIIKSIAENGNQIGNHTYDHKQLTKLSSKAIIDEVTKTNNILKNITNATSSVIRPTYGSVNKNVKQYAGGPLILWSIDTLDWKSKNEKMIVNRALKNVKDGDIILMHDIYKTTASAADIIIKELSSRGFQMVTIDELYTAREIDLVKGKVYRNAYKKK